MNIHEDIYTSNLLRREKLTHNHSSINVRIRANHPRLQISFCFHRHKRNQTTYFHSGGSVPSKSIKKMVFSFFSNKSSSQAASGSDHELLENFLDIETLNKSTCSLINRTLYKSSPAERQQLQSYYYACLDTMFRKLALYRTSKQQSMNWQCSSYPDYAIVHSVLTNQNKPLYDAETGRELTMNEKVTALLECQSCNTCPKKKLRKDMVEDKLKPALHGAFLSTFPALWIKEMDTLAAKEGDVAFSNNISKKEDLIRNSYCNQYQPGADFANFVPHVVHPNSKELYVPSKEAFEKEKQITKYQLCINSMMCASFSLLNRLLVYISSCMFTMT